MIDYNFQKIVDTVNAANRDTRSGYHLTLGALIELLKSVPEYYRVTLEGAENVDSGIHKPHSYRGYYSDLAFELCPVEEKVCYVKDVLQDAAASLDEVFEGYKGGDFPMDANTPLWLSPWGFSTQIAFVGYRVDSENKKVVLITKKIKD